MVCKSVEVWARTTFWGTPRLVLAITIHSSGIVCIAYLRVLGQGAYIRFLAGHRDCNWLWRPMWPPLWWREALEGMIVEGLKRVD